MSDDVQHIPRGVHAAARDVLRRRYGSRVDVVDAVVVRSGHAVVARVYLSGSPIPTAMLKLAHRDQSGRFNPAEDKPHGSASRLWNEWAGLEFCASLDVPDPVVPAFYGGDTELGFVLMEDLGDGPSLAEVLLRADAAAARTALEGYVDTLADLHLATFGQTERYDELRASLGPRTGELRDLIWNSWPTVTAAIDQLDPTLSGDMAAEAVDWMHATAGDGGRWRAYSPNDCCPDNNVVADGGRLRLFDLEFGDCHHALRDLAYLRAIMPTCWCVRRLPAGLADKLVERYRQRLLDGGFDTGTEFEPALTACEAQLAILRLSWNLEPALQPNGGEQEYIEPYDFQLPSRRQQVLLRLDNLVDAAARQPELASLGELAQATRSAALKTWGPIQPMPLYPAFQ